jgi:hypothetical protein
MQKGDVFESQVEGYRNLVQRLENNQVWLEITLAPHAKGPPEHLHLGFDEVFTVRQGRVRLRLLEKNKFCKSVKACESQPTQRICWTTRIPSLPNSSAVVCRLLSLRDWANCTPLATPTPSGSSRLRHCCFWRLEAWILTLGWRLHHCPPKKSCDWCLRRWRGCWAIKGGCVGRVRRASRRPKS